MDEKLIKSLRACAENNTKRVCFTCPWALHQKGCITAMVTAAADAIEGLEEKAQAYAETLYAYEHPWIPVTERLPESGECVLVACGTRSGTDYVCKAFYVAPKTIPVEGDWECDCEYDEESDEYYLTEGWLERIHNWDEYASVYITDTVTHWMSLPAPPKEMVTDSNQVQEGEDNG